MRRPMVGVPSVEPFSTTRTSKSRSSAAQAVDHLADGRTEQRSLVVGRDDDRQHESSGVTAHLDPNAPADPGTDGVYRRTFTGSSAPVGSIAARPPHGREGGFHGRDARRPEAARRRLARPARRDRRRQRRRAVRRPPPTPSSNVMANRLAHGLLALGAAAGRAGRVVRTQLARGHHGHPRGPQGRPGRGAALVPLHRRGDAVRHRQLRRHRRSWSTPSRRRSRVGARPACRRSAACVVYGGDVRRPGSSTGTSVLAAEPETEPPIDATRRPVGAHDDLHVGHHRASRRARCAPRTDPETVLRAARRARLPAGQRGAPHHRAALPLRSARCSRRSPTRSARPIIVLRKFDPARVAATR